ncbi:MAG: lipopolysaccharide assembly protein LapA domain-containing protein [Cellulomonas sp.]|uniref:LapA family protein n=1 Tax=unclassified Cellulomonas TaxID=2620175 RepID=UPI00069F8E48|nr:MULTISPECIES: lipopolysaccharide assembly protein LapA domain-containing protein [unclassified Cellulomonas]MCR6648863.1 lipopolysaccharide assembly protein LapA domain-containing protein [Cellulomonas sp.]MCR6704844.1 lipopolysaccharide assembly protein LapA domain-containing protein [Cellulomonas sp.]
MPVQRNTPTSRPNSSPLDVPMRPLPDGYRPSKVTQGSPTDRPLRSRTGAAWVGVCVGVLVLIALVVFMMQNTTPVEVTFLGMSGSAPLSLVLLIAGIGVGLIALVIGSLRIGQLRRRIRTDRQAATASTV